MSNFVITIDGPAASGKGSLSKSISKEINFYYLETGIYYRGFANLYYNSQFKGLDLSTLISNFNIFDFKKYIYKNNKELYSANISKQASKVAKILEVRELMVKIQQNLIVTLDKKFNGIILEGRDCGTVVAPQADIKFYLTANLKVRAERRLNQFIKDKKDIGYEKVLSDLKDRDRQDKNRKYSPLQKPKDAVVIDNSCYNFEETINIVKKIIFSRIPSLKNKT